MKKVFFITLIAILLISCNSGKKNTDNRTVFRYNENVGITSLDPAFAKDKARIWACNQLFNGLVQLDNDLKVKPCIAKRWTISDGGKLYTFTIRDDVVFHDHGMKLRFCSRRR